jgi:YegS/Rv2252/BmrU family lipid kinase
VYCVLIYNPVSGRKLSRRAEQIRQVAAALSDLGHRVEIVATTAAGTATDQSRQAVRDGANTVFACGGDGTIHEVVQGLVSETGLTAAALGIIPLGSANASARHLRLSLDPIKAALQQIDCTAKRIPVGRIKFDGQVRYFTVMTGAGPDGALVYDLLTSHKSRIGRMAYYLHAARLFATRHFAPFAVAYVDAESGARVTTTAVSAMAVRVDSLGGLFSKLTSGSAHVQDATMKLLILSHPAWLALPLWFISGWLHIHGLNRFLRSVRVTSFSCRPLSSRSAHFQADGEWLGRIPMEVSLIPDALRMLMPVPYKQG